MSAEIQLGTVLVAKLRNTVGDPSGATQTRWMDEELADYLDRGQMQVALDEPRIFQTQWTCDLTAGTREYALPSNWIAVQSVEFIHVSATDIRKLVGVSYETYQNWLLHDEDAQGDPEYFYIWRKLGSTATGHIPPSIFLHPTPQTSTSGSDDRLRIVGYKMPDDVAEDTSKTAELEALFVEAAVMYAAALVFMDDEDLARHDRAMAMYREMVEKIISVIARRDFSRSSRLLPKGARRGLEESNVQDWIRWSE